MTAQEARNLSEQYDNADKQWGIIMDLILAEASRGGRYIWFNNLHTEVLQTLLEFDYKVQSIDDSPLNKISW